MKHILSPFSIWNTFSDMDRYIMELTLTLYHVFKAWFDVFWQARISVHQFFLASGRSWRSHLIMKTQVKTSRKRVSVGQKWPKDGTRVEWEYSISWTCLCSGDFKKLAFSRLVRDFASVFNDLLSGKARQHCAWRHFNRTWEFRNHRKECVR